jgi:hypothetical protein
LVGETEEPVPGSKCKINITSYYNGEVYTGLDFAKKKRPEVYLMAYGHNNRND